MVIRNASMEDLAAVTAVEAACFPAAEAATEQDFAKRLQVYPNHFWLLEDENGRLISFVNGLVTDEPSLHRKPDPDLGRFGSCTPSSRYVYRQHLGPRSAPPGI